MPVELTDSFTLTLFRLLPSSLVPTLAAIKASAGTELLATLLALHNVFALIAQHSTSPCSKMVTREGVEPSHSGSEPDARPLGERVVLSKMEASA